MKAMQPSFRFALFALLASAATLAAQNNPAWTTSYPAFRIAGNLYYVGSQDLGSYLIATPRGLSSSIQASKLPCR